MPDLVEIPEDRFCRDADQCILWETVEAKHKEDVQVSVYDSYT